MMDINRIARPDIVAMAPYESARSSAVADGILLNANEAPCTLVAELNWDRLSLNRYPAPQPAKLRHRLARLYGVAETQLLITRGSDEGIDLLTRVFCRAGKDAVIECPPCFGMYKIAATIQGARVTSVPRLSEQGLTIDYPSLARAIKEQPGVRLVFLTSPNNPTGDLIQRAELEQLLNACEDRALLVLDEAYIEFCEADSASELVAQWPQLVVLRTLSKAWAAAGLRCGTVIAAPVVIDLLLRVIAPYPLSTIAMDAALQVTAGSIAAGQQQLLATISAGKTDLLAFLQTCEWVKEVWVGEANFVLLRVPDAKALVEWCADAGIRIRDFSSQALLENCVRMSIGNNAEITSLKSTLRAFEERL